MSERFPRRLGRPPSTITGPLQRYVQDIADSMNELPRFSTFSFNTPESNVTAQAPTLGMNEASGYSRVWAKVVGSGNTGWVSVA